MERYVEKKSSFKIVMTGGPGGGKTTAADLYRRELGEQVVVVPEAATILYAGGFPRLGAENVRKATQRAIYHVQKDLEDVHSLNYASRVLLCDRGTVDGAAYWPNHPEDFFEFMGSDLQSELHRYDAVIFFETAAVGGMSIEGGNPTRIESLEEAASLDKKLRALWSQHPQFVFVPHNPSFLKKISAGLSSLAQIVNKLNKLNS